jgi:hypothetical protein
MKGYVHQGVMGADGIVHTARSISDPSALRVLPSDDGLHLDNTEVGNFEWWYLDIIDSRKSIVIKIAAHLGTDPLRRNFFPQLVVAVKTGNTKKSFSKRYSLSDLQASRSVCDLHLKDEFHLSHESSDNGDRYLVVIDLDEFKGHFTFFSKVEGWKPLGAEVNLTRGRKNAGFSWIIPVPWARVIGEFSCDNRRDSLADASGYHDHNYWRVGEKDKLFMDEVISKWYWGRISAGDYGAVFMETHFRGRSVRSFMLAKNTAIIHSSNDLVEVSLGRFRQDEEIKAWYPAEIEIRSEKESFQVIVKARELIDRRDLLDGMNPLIKWLIKHLVSRPAYFGVMADAAVTVAGAKNEGMALYESMLFRKSIPR